MMRETARPILSGRRGSDKNLLGRNVEVAETGLAGIGEQDARFRVAVLGEAQRKEVPDPLLFICVYLCSSVAFL